MNVSALTDVELNRAMIWLYPDCIYGRSKGAIYSRHSSFIGFVDVGFLDVWDLTMPLAVENKLDMDCDAELWRIYGPSASYSKHKSLLRAICESLVMIKMEGK